MRKRFDEISLIIVTLARVWEGKKEEQRERERKSKRAPEIIV